MIGNIEKLPEVIGRRPDGPSIGAIFKGDIPLTDEQLDSPAPDDYDGYLESDRSWMENNRTAVIWFLENRDELDLLYRTHVLGTE